VIEIPFPGNKVLRLVTGDITRVVADAIVNAANSALAGGGGVDGAIHRAGGPSIMQELHGIRRQIGSCPAGNAVVTGAGELPARWVFHAVGPVYIDGNHGEAAALASCYRTCLALAREREAGSISFPSISTGAYGYPVAEAAQIALDVVTDFLQETEPLPTEVTFVLFDQPTYEAYSKRFQNREN
jgi:O-acetyl-ADP-ribose deacetylase (regulator of RNase III)